MTPAAEVPFCKDCAHLLGKRTVPEFAPGWQCLAEQNIKSVRLDPVTGAPLREYKYPTCYDARSDHKEAVRSGEPVITSCGSQGQWFKLYEQPQYALSGKRPSTGGKSGDDLLSELENI